MAYARNAKETECTEENTGSRTQSRVTRVGCVRQVIKDKKRAETCILEIMRKRRTSQLKKKNAFPTRFQKKKLRKKNKKRRNLIVK